MAPTHDRARRRGGGGTGHLHRYANTNAGVNHSQSSAATRAGETHRRRNREYRGRPAATVPVHASLANRMTYSNGRGHGHGYASLAHGGAHRPQRQRGRPLQDRITHADNGHTGGSGIGVNTIPRAQTGHRAQQILHTTAATDVPNANDDIDININSDIELDELDFFTPRPPIDDDNALNDNTSSTLFYSSQPTQLAHRPRPTSTPRPIRMLNERPRVRPVNDDSDADDERPAPHKRPVNTYRGSDPIKRLVQNPKLRAIFADKPVPKERKAPRDERMDLRMGMGRVMK